MIGGMTYGAKRDKALKHYQHALELNPDSAIARIEYANGLVMLDGKKALKEAEALYADAAKFEAADAMERLDVELAEASSNRAAPERCPALSARDPEADVSGVPQGSEALQLAPT